MKMKKPICKHANLCLNERWKQVICNACGHRWSCDSREKIVVQYMASRKAPATA